MPYEPEANGKYYEIYADNRFFEITRDSGVYNGTSNETEYDVTESYTYKNSGTDGINTGSQLDTHQVTVGATSVTYSFSYDDKGNITKVAYSNGTEVRYVYDSLGQLIREDNVLPI